MERRQFPRISLMGEIIIKAKESAGKMPGGQLPPAQLPGEQLSGEQLTGYAINISRGGIAFYSERPFNINTELYLTLFFKDEGGEMREGISGIVRWIKPVGNIFALGVQFRNISKDKQPVLFKYLESSEYVVF